MIVLSCLQISKQLLSDSAGVPRIRAVGEVISWCDGVSRTVGSSYEYAKIVLGAWESTAISVLIADYTISYSVPYVLITGTWSTILLENRCRLLLLC